MSRVNGVINLLFSLMATGGFVVAYMKEFSPATEAKLEKSGILIFKNYGGRYKYLTILNLMGQILYFSLCSLNAFIELFLYSNRNDAKVREKNILRKICNLIYTSFAYPVGLLVTIVFWGLYLFDRKLIFPEVLDSIIPPWQNHLLHTLPLVTAILDSFITKHDYSKSFIIGILPTFLLSTGYLIWVLIVAYYGNIWVYPIMKVLSPAYRVVFFGVLFVFIAFLYQSGKHLNQLVWKEEKKSHSHSQSQSPSASPSKLKKANKKPYYKPKKEN